MLLEPQTADIRLRDAITRVVRDLGGREDDRGLDAGAALVDFGPARFAACRGADVERGLTGLNGEVEAQFPDCA